MKTDLDYRNLKKAIKEFDEAPTMHEAICNSVDAFKDEKTTEKKAARTFYETKEGRKTATISFRLEIETIKKLEKLTEKNYSKKSLYLTKLIDEAAENNE